MNQHVFKSVKKTEKGNKLKNTQSAPSFQGWEFDSIVDFPDFLPSQTHISIKKKKKIL